MGSGVRVLVDTTPDLRSQALAYDLDRVDAILFDLGVSSMQLDVADRGFAYSQDAALDMRMDQTQGITAAEVLNTYPVGDLARILRTYGEEKFAGPLARAIVRTSSFTRSPSGKSARATWACRRPYRKYAWSLARSAPRRSRWAGPSGVSTTSVRA